ncbi:hypothetical protein [Cytobacillus firmus]|nr:hypothetical protein [Cytobacillus firmus]MEC1894351.1 hypothetical protein [Cytobacillus firmus]
MQVISHISNTNKSPADIPLEIKTGEVSRAQIKERLSDTEAVINIRGREFQAKFEGGVPSSDRVTVQITDQKEQAVTVKTIAAENPKSPAGQTGELKVLQSVGLSGDEKPELKKAVQTLLDKGSPISKEIVRDLKEFMDHAKGTTESKLETVKALANKRLEATGTQLRAVHEALHGKPLSEVLTDLAKEIDPNFKLEKATEKKQADSGIQNNRISVAVQNQIAGNLDGTGNEIKPISHELKRMIKTSIESLRAEPDLENAIQQIRTNIVNHPDIDPDLAQRIDNSVSEAQKLQFIGRERLLQALQSAEEHLLRKEVMQLKIDASISETIKGIRDQIQLQSNSKVLLQNIQDHLLTNKQIDPETASQIEKLAKQISQLDAAGRDRLLKILQETLAQTRQQSGLRNPGLLGQVPEQAPSEAIKQLIKQFQKEPILGRALDNVLKEISSHPAIDKGIIDKAEKAISQASQLQNEGRELAARQHITRELTDIEQILAKTEPKPADSMKASLEVLQYDLNEQLQSMGIQSKDILVTKITQKLAQATYDFRELKREITRNLDNVEHLISTFKKNAYPQAKQMLETAISKLDNAILKSEMMLFTDMKTEKQLMQASSQLAEAKKLLAKGDHAQAGKIVSEVKTLIDKVIFKPSEQKVVHFVAKESMMLEKQPGAQHVVKQFNETASGFINGEPSARQMFEMVKSMGLNHDSDIANSLVFNKNDQSQQEKQQNLKVALMKLVQGEGQETNSKIAQQAEQALTNLTGQQLLSKSDASGTLQSMFFNLPMLLGGKPENLQVFVNSKNEGQQVDWENCNLYFLLETKKLGDVGILLNSTDRNLSITIKNDLPGFKEKMEPLAVFTKEKLQEVGYNVSSINFTRMSAPQPKPAPDQGVQAQENDPKSLRPVFTEKGMDFKI